jgi:hypothetical protein
MLIVVDVRNNMDAKNIFFMVLEGFRILVLGVSDSILKVFQNSDND